MKITQRFTVARPIDAVWASFKNVPRVAACMPGAELTQDKGDGVYAGKVSFRLGPFSASFEGEAKVVFDDAARSGRVEGKGVDKRGGSRSRMVVDFRVGAPDAATSEVTLDADIVLSGAIAQFGRTNLVQETAKLLIGDFVQALEAQLAERPDTTPQAAPEPAPRQSTMSVWSLLWRLATSFVRRQPRA